MNKLESFLSSTLFGSPFVMCVQWVSWVNSVIFQSWLKLLMVGCAHQTGRASTNCDSAAMLFITLSKTTPVASLFFEWAKTEISASVKEAGVRLPLVGIFLPTILSLNCHAHIYPHIKVSRGENRQCSILTQPCNHLSNSPLWILKTITEQ